MAVGGKGQKWVDVEAMALAEGTSVPRRPVGSSMRHHCRVTRVSACEALEFRSELYVCPWDPQACCRGPRVVSRQRDDAVLSASPVLCIWEKRGNATCCG